MPNLYLTEQGSVLRKKGGRLVVEKDGAALLDVECHRIGSVLVFGNVQVTTQAVQEMLGHGIEMAIFTRTGRLVGQITSPSTKNIDLRIAQFKRHEDEGFRAGLSAAIVKGKIKNSIQLLRGFVYNHPEVSLYDEIRELESSLESIVERPSAEALNGVEGMAARRYFSAFGKTLLSGFDFTGRLKRPPPDPVNALLSLGYTFVYNEISSLLDGMGFDPYLGYYHSVEYGRASLASDLQEEFRAPVVDRLTLRLVNNRVLTAADFYANPKGSGVYLTRDGMKKYFAGYEDFMNAEFTHPETKDKTNFRKCFRIQIEKLASHIKGEKEYIPFFMEL